MIRRPVGSDPAGMALAYTGGLGRWLMISGAKPAQGCLEPFGSAGFGRIWGHVGACYPVGLLLGKTGKARDVPNVRNTAAYVDGARNGWHVAAKPARWAWRCALTGTLVVCSDAAGLLAVFITMHVYCDGRRCR